MSADMIPPPAERLTPAGYAAAEGISPKTVRHWIRYGVGGVRLRAIRFGGRIVFTKADLTEFLRQTQQTN